MSHAKPSSKPGRRNKVAPMLGVAGLSLSLAGGASAVTGGPETLTPNPSIRTVDESTLGEEAMHDVSLAPFSVANQENAGTVHPGREFRRKLAGKLPRKLAMGGGCGGGCAACVGWSSNYGAAPESDAGLQHRSTKPTHPPKRTQVPK
jgi:hypothetical protein